MNAFNVYYNKRFVCTVVAADQRQAFDHLLAGPWLFEDVAEFEMGSPRQVYMPTEKVR